MGKVIALRGTPKRKSAKPGATIELPLTYVLASEEAVNALSQLSAEAKKALDIWE